MSKIYDPGLPFPSRSEVKPKPRLIQTPHEVTQSMLPLSCPPTDTPLWNLHPRVFLELDHQHPEVDCPYCGARYKLVD